LGDPVERIFGRGDIAGAVVGQRRRPVERIGRGEQSAQRVIRKGGGGVGRIERILRFGQEATGIIEEPRDLVVRIRDREGIARGIVGDRGQMILGICDARHLIERRLVGKRRRGGNALLRAREQIALYIIGQKLFCMPSLEEDNGLRG